MYRVVSACLCAMIVGEWLGMATAFRHPIQNTRLEPLYMLPSSARTFSSKNLYLLGGTKVGKYAGRLWVKHTDELREQSELVSEQQTSTDRERLQLKKTLFARSAACDRGFNASPRERGAILQIVGELSSLSPELSPTRNFYHSSVTGVLSVADDTANSTSESFSTYPSDVPLEGAWQMVFTNAYDVLLLGGNPLINVQGVYQILTREGKAVNIIDVCPRIQALLPPRLVGEGSTLRLKVNIDASVRSANQVTLKFRSVEFKPLTLAGRSVVSLLPALKAVLPQSLLDSAPAKRVVNAASSAFPRRVRALLPFGTSDEQGDDMADGFNGGDDGDGDERGAVDGGDKGEEVGLPRGYFDILYLDEECLIIDQGAQGGVFVLVRSSEPMQSYLDV